MTRSADYSIKGFLYQFLLTLQTLLSGEKDAICHIEGINEDIEYTDGGTNYAIQCKYHETKTKFQLSDVYKPVLQMLSHFQNCKNPKVKYILHCHFPNEIINSERTLTTSELETIIGTKNKEYSKYVEEIRSDINLNDFSNTFKIRFGHNYNDIQDEVKTLLVQSGFSDIDVDDIILPNAVQIIADYSILHDSSQRVISKTELLTSLHNKKTTAISRWTIELISKEKLLKKRREQLKSCLNPNSRERCIILDADYIENFNHDATIFICDYLSKYNSKIFLNKVPFFCIKASDTNVVNDIWMRLNKKSILVERGQIGNDIDISRILREPQRKKNPLWIEFNVRLFDFENDLPLIIKQKAFHDLIIISDKYQTWYSDFATDCNVEILETPVINELRYLLNMSVSL